VGYCFRLPGVIYKFENEKKKNLQITPGYLIPDQSCAAWGIHKTPATSYKPVDFLS
jgi:hypothetical protein